MKQSAAKTLGTAALGAAFVAAAAGSAGAVALPAAPDLATTLGTVTSTLPVEQIASTLPAGGPEAVKAGTDALRQSATTAPNALPPVVPGGEGADPVSGLLGGLPTGALPMGAVPGLGA